MSVLPPSVFGSIFVPHTHCHHSMIILCPGDCRSLWTSLQAYFLVTPLFFAWKSGASFKNGNIKKKNEKNGNMIVSFLCWQPFSGFQSVWGYIPGSSHGFALWSHPAYLPCPSQSPQFPLKAVCLQVHLLENFSLLAELPFHLHLVRF